MSEFSRAQKVLNEIKRDLESTPSLNRSTLLSYQQNVESILQPTALKYEAKLQEKDAISGEPRLGPQMSQKVVMFKGQVEELSALILAKLKEVVILEEDSGVVDDSIQHGGVRIKGEINEVVAPRTLNSLFSFDKEESMRRRDVPVAPLVTALRRDEDEGLSDAAKTAREKRKTSILMEKELIVSTFRDLKSQPRGIDVALSILDQMKSKHSNGDINILKSFLKTLLDNISRNPDNEMLRTIRANNATVYEKVTKYPEGMNLLVAIGFTPMKDNEAEEYHFNQSTVLDGDGTWKHLDVMNLILFKLIEPSPEVDMEAWIAWFDGLKDYAAIFA